MPDFNFIEYFISYTKEAESPTEFWRWAAIAGIAATLRNNVHLTSPQLGTIFPNMYVILFSDSGIARKAAPCKLMGKLVQAIGNTKFINGRASMQGVIKELGLSYTNEKGVLLNGAAAMLYSEELSSFAVSDPATIPLLIDLYDYHESWRNNLIGWTTALKDVCITLLAASNSDLFRSVYTAQAITGGLLGRTFIIKEDKYRHRKSFFDLQKSELDIKLLLNHLKKVAVIKGEIECEARAIQFYNDWYYDIPDEAMQDKVGYASRLGTHVLKVAISLGAAREDFDKTLNIEDIEQAIDLCQGIKKHYKMLTAGSGTSPLATQATYVLRAIISERGYHIARKDLIRKLLGNVDIEDLDKILVMLVQGELLQEISKNMEPGYKLTVKGIDEFILGDEKDETNS